MSKIPSWLPDWKDESQYKDHGDDYNKWAWEFLRRNPEYQADWDEVTEGRPARNPHTDESWAWDLGFVWTGDGPPKGAYKKALELGKKWGLFHGPIVNPGHVRMEVGSSGPTKHPMPYTIWSRDEHELGIEVKIHLPSIEDVKNATVIFDLRLDIERQLSAVQKSLERCQQILVDEGVITLHKTDPQIQLYKTYLRLLDAHTTHGPDMSHLEIAKRLLPDPVDENSSIQHELIRSRVKKQYNKAKELRDRGYRTFIS